MKNKSVSNVETGPPPPRPGVISETEVVAPELKRVNLNLTKSGYDSLATAAKRQGVSMTELIRWGIALVIVALDAARSGGKLVVVSPQGEPTREIVLPH
jgi:hypothetical protein